MLTKLRSVWNSWAKWQKLTILFLVWFLVITAEAFIVNDVIRIICCFISGFYFGRQWGRIVQGEI